MKNNNEPPIDMFELNKLKHENFKEYLIKEKEYKNWLNDNRLKDKKKMKNEAVKEYAFKHPERYKEITRKATKKYQEKKRKAKNEK